jgi:epoxyqueuosine reductase
MLTAERIKQHAKELGFDLCGIAPVGAFPELGFLREWLDRGFAGHMGYLPRTAKIRADVRRIMPSARSVIMTGTIYNSALPYSTERDDPAVAEVARYACADDYHDVLARRLDALVSWMRDEQPGPPATPGTPDTPGTPGTFEARAYVDTGPVQERVYAQYAGLGWIGKNACVINPAMGSWIVLAEIICSLPLEPDQPSLDQCGTCTLCLDACPTHALVAPRVLDATKCVSYLTIEYRGTIPDEHLEGIGHHLFGCDICQEVCPWNAAAPHANDAWPSRPGLSLLTLAQLAETSDAELTEMIAGTPLIRAGVKGLRRNLEVGQRGTSRTLAPPPESA